MYPPQTHLRQLYVILNNHSEGLFLYEGEDFDYVVIYDPRPSSAPMKCFGCGEKAHLIKVCVRGASRNQQPSAAQPIEDQGIDRE